jgi:hypothetical protein
MLLAAVLSLFAVPALRADLARDASSPRIVGEEGEWVLENAFELEQDKFGKTWSFETPLQFVPRVLPKLALLLEPVFWEREEPKHEPAVSGMGDTDLAVAYLVLPAKEAWPAVVVAGKVKFPTADRKIGTGKADYSASIIVGKTYGELDLSLELEYETYGQPGPEPDEPSGENAETEEAGDDPEDSAMAEAPEEDPTLKDQFIYTLSAEYGLTDQLDVYIEFFGNSKPTAQEKASCALGGGLEYSLDITDFAAPFVSVGYDTDELFTAKAGVEWNW